MLCVGLWNLLRAAPSPDQSTSTRDSPPQYLLDGHASAPSASPSSAPPSQQQQLGQLPYHAAPNAKVTSGLVPNSKEGPGSQALPNSMGQEHGPLHWELCQTADRVHGVPLQSSGAVHPGEAPRAVGPTSGLRSIYTTWQKAQVGLL